MFDKVKERYNKSVFERYKDSLISFGDLIGDGYSRMSNLFYCVNKRYLHWLSNDPDIAVSRQEVSFRKRLYRLLQVIGPSMLKCTQVIENRKWLNNQTSKEQDDPIVLPDKPVIFVSNHGFYDDALASSLAAGRHGYFLWGSLPLLFNTFNGLAVTLVGAVIVNRKSKKSREASINKAVKVMEYGSDILLYPEGGWNKTMEKPVLHLWKGVYNLSCAAQCDVVPIVHYVRDMEVLNKKNTIHTVVDNPIPLYKMCEEEALEYLRDVIASWQFKMMEAYGKSNRDNELDGLATAQEKWAQHLFLRMSTVGRYDSEIELCADYRPRYIIHPEDVWRPIAEISHVTAHNARDVIFARRLVHEAEKNDFQHRF